MRPGLLMLGPLLLAPACASIAVVQDPEPVPRGEIRGGVGFGGYAESAGPRGGGWLVPQVDARFGLGGGFDLGARLTPLELTFDLKGLLHSKDGFAVAVGGGGGGGADPVGALSAGRMAWGTARGYAILRWRTGRLSLYGGPQVTFGPVLTGDDLEDPWLVARAGGFAGLGVQVGPLDGRPASLYFEVQAGGLRWHPAGDASDGRQPQGGGYVAPTVAVAWDWFAPGGIW